MIRTAVQAPKHRPAAVSRAAKAGAETSWWNFTELESLCRRPSPFSEGHRRICLALLEGVYRDVIQFRDYGSVVPIGVMGRHARLKDERVRLSTELHRWLEGRQDHALSLANVCLVLDLDAAAIRDGLQRILWARREARPTGRGHGPIRRGNL